MSEKIHQGFEQSQKNLESLEVMNAEKHAEIERKLEQAAEKSSAEKIEDVRNEAIELAHTAEKTQENATSENERQIDIGDKNPTQHALDESYKKTLKTMQSQLSAPSRTFSKVIHNPVVEKTSEIAGNTVARPNIILAMAISAAFSVLLYFIARVYGYVMSGSETLVLFGLGWIIGAIIEFARVGFLSRK